MSIPLARIRLAGIADRLEAGALGRPAMAAEIRAIIDGLMYRESPVRRAPRKLSPLTPEMAEQIRKAAIERPEASQLELANWFGTNPGRVSEVLNNKV